MQDVYSMEKHSFWFGPIVRFMTIHGVYYMYPSLIVRFSSLHLRPVDISSRVFSSTKSVELHKVWYTFYIIMTFLVFFSKDSLVHVFDTPIIGRKSIRGQLTESNVTKYSLNLLRLQVLWITKVFIIKI